MRIFTRSFEEMEAKYKLEQRNLLQEVAEVKHKLRVSKFGDKIAEAIETRRSGQISAALVRQSGPSRQEGVKELSASLEEKADQIRSERRVLDRAQHMLHEAELKIEDLLKDIKQLRANQPSTLQLPLALEPAETEVKEVSDLQPKSYEQFAREIFRSELGSAANETPYHVALNI